jgi:uncharacterized protein DUF4136
MWTIRRPAVLLCSVMLLLTATGVVLDAGMKVTVQRDERFDFTTLKTWTWDTPAPGKVILLRTKDDNPEQARQRFEPTVMDAVTAELPKRGLAPAAGGAAGDVRVAYYLIVTVGANSEYMGYNIPGSVSWVLPPFNPATTRLEVVQRGSVVVDIISPAKQMVIWRGMAKGDIDEGKTDDQRKTRIREAVAKVLAKYPPKK